jgi:hypothetical protein
VTLLGPSGNVFLAVSMAHSVAELAGSGVSSKAAQPLLSLWRRTDRHHSHSPDGLVRPS